MNKDKSQNTIPIKVTLRPKQIEIVKDLAGNQYDDNFSISLRTIINDYPVMKKRIKELEG